MLTKDDKVYKVNGLKDEQIQDIINFLQGAVYCWCKNRKSEWFSLRDLMGGDNFYWDKTPLSLLYLKYKDKVNPINRAGKDAGWILKKVIKNDSRMFETKYAEQIRKYRWTGQDNV